MQYKRLGKTGLKVSDICMGTMTFAMKGGWRNYALGIDEAKPVFKKALDLGINFFDTADVYSLGSCEEVTGKLLNEMTNREEVVIATKVYGSMNENPNMSGLSRKHIFSAINASLKRLNMDYVDLYIIHRWDYETPIEETMEALNDLVKMGKVRYIGASSMYSWQFSKAQSIAEKNNWSKFVSMQNHYNLIYREEEREMIPMCIDSGIAITPWSPLARGFLTGSRFKEGGGKTQRSKNDDIADKMYYNKTDFKILDQVVSIAKKLNILPAQVALAWILQNKAISAPVIGVSDSDQLVELVNTLNITLSTMEIKNLEKFYQPKNITGHN